MSDNNTLIKVENLRKWFPVKRGLVDLIMRRERKYVRAVDRINFDIKKKEIFGLAGESGSGKTTTGRLLLRLIEPDEGKIYYKGKDIANLPAMQFIRYRKRMQIIQQDPYGSLSPRMRILEIVREPLDYLEPFLSEEEKLDRVYAALEEVRLHPVDEILEKYPHQLSGGQRQRVAIARALIVKPEFIVADEPVSMLDVSVRAGILNLLMDLREREGISFLYITHDLATAGYVTDRIGIMYLGKIVEIGPVDKVLMDPLHPYTKALIEAVPEPDPTGKKMKSPLKGEIPSPIDIPSGCRFRTRCPLANKCPLASEKEPELVEVEPGRFIACHFIAKEYGAL